MKLKENELKIYYKVKDGIDIYLDKAIIELAEKFGYKWVASGLTFKTGVRDLAFDIMETPKMTADAVGCHFAYPNTEDSETYKRPFGSFRDVV